MNEARQETCQNRQPDQRNQEQPCAGDEVGQQRRRHETHHNGVGGTEPVECNHCRPDPGGDRQRLAYKAAREREHRRKRDDHENGEINGVHDTTPTRPLTRVGSNGARLGDMRATRSLRCPIATVASPAPPPASRRLTPPLGTHAWAKPSLAASLSRASLWPTGRTSPDSAISPKTTVSAGTGVSRSAETSAAATARSAAGSAIRKPPAMLR